MQSRTGLYIVIAVTALLSGAGFVANVVMPDIFAGLTILSASVYLIAGTRMSRLQASGWLSLLLIALLSHKSHILIAAFVFGIALCMRRHLRVSGFRSVAAVILVGLVGSLLVGPVARIVIHAEPLEPPFLLARVIADGPGEKYLRQSCVTHAYTSCRFLPKMPMTENEFLWSRNRERGAFALLDLSDKKKVVAEQFQIVIGTVQNFFFSQAFATLGNILRQLSTVGVEEYGLVPNPTTLYSFNLSNEVSAYQSSPIASRRFMLSELSTMANVTMLFSLILLCCTLFIQRGRMSQRLMDFGILVVCGVVINAVICGAISGTFDRYQIRVAWLLTFVCGMMLARRVEDRRPSTIDNQ